MSDPVARKMRKVADKIIRKRTRNSKDDDKACTDLCDAEEATVRRGKCFVPFQMPLPQNGSQIPEFAPGFQILDVKRVFSIFSQTKMTFYNFPFINPDIKKFIAHYSADNVVAALQLLPNQDAEMYTYVMYYIACLKDQRNAAEHKRMIITRRCSVTLSDLQTILGNFGVSKKNLPLPIREGLRSYAKDKVKRFPYENFEMVLKVFCKILLLEQIAFGEKTDKIMLLLIKITFDKLIRGTPTFGLAIRFLSIFIGLCYKHHGESLTFTWVNAVEHPMNKLEVCRFLRLPYGLWRKLVVHTLQSMLSITANRFCQENAIYFILLICRHKVVKSPLEVYVALQLLILLLPHTVILEEHTTEMNQELLRIESLLPQLANRTDEMRLRNICAQVHGLILISVGLKRL